MAEPKSNEHVPDSPSRYWRRFRETLWERHANPRSGWSRVLVLPVLMCGIYLRRPRVVAGAIGFSLVNPVLFSPPTDDDAWMTQVVLGERMYYRHRGRRRPVELLNYANGFVTACAVYSAYRKRPVKMGLFTAAAMAMKFLFIGYVAKYYRENRERYPDDVPDFGAD